MLQVLVRQKLLIGQRNAIAVKKRMSRRLLNQNGKLQSAPARSVVTPDLHSRYAVLA
jgi:hypothetical protein